MSTTSTTSCFMRRLDKVKDALSECEAFQEMAEQYSPEEATQRITVGPMPDPPDGEEHTIVDLENQFCYAAIYPADNGVLAERGPEVHGYPRQEMVVDIELRRQLRDIEMVGGLANAWRAFMDQVFRIMEGELYFALYNHEDGGEPIQAMNLTRRPEFVSKNEEPRIGNALCCMLSADLARSQES